MSGKVFFMNVFCILKNEILLVSNAIKFLLENHPNSVFYVFIEYSFSFKETQEKVLKIYQEINIENNPTFDLLVIPLDSIPSICPDLIIVGQDQQLINKYPNTPKINIPYEISPIKITKSIENNINKFDIVCLGGTFDHLHYGHKLLLTMAAFLCKKTLICGVTG